MVAGMGCGGLEHGPGTLGSGNPGQPAGSRCPVSGPVLAALPYGGSLYLPENFELFIQADGAAAGDLQVSHRDGTPVATQFILPIAPGIFQIHPSDIGCEPRECKLDVVWGAQSTTLGGNVHPFGGVDNTPPELDAGLTLTDPEVDENCPRAVALRAHMNRGRGPRGSNAEPQTSTPVHLIEMQDGAASWTPIGGIVAFNRELDFDIYVDRGIGRRCFRGVAIDSAGHITRDPNPFCFDPGL